MGREPIRFGLVGLGRHGERYARHLLADLPEATLTALCRRDRVAGEAFARQHGVAFYSDHRALLESGTIDALAVVVPPDRCSDICVEALGRRIPVLVEKPMGHTAAAARAIVAATEACGVPLMVAQTLRFDTVVGAIKARIPEIGRMHAIALSQRFEPSDRTWIDREGPGGIVLNTGVHGFDLVRFLTGSEVTEVICATARVVTRETEDQFAAILRMRSGPALATVDGSRASGGRSGRVEVVGEHGQLVGDHVLGHLSLVRGREWTPIPLPPSVPTVRECLAAFCRVLRDGAPPPVTARDGLRALEIVEACHRSAAAGKPVAVPV